jgi:hypothetical protein
VTTIARTAKRCEIVRRGLLSQRWYARFIADNNLKLARTEHYVSLGDLKAMLAKYFPDWPVVMISRQKR